MILQIVTYGNPVLRAKGARIETITPDITDLIADMLETMYAARGIGLAAQQIGRSIQLTVLDVRGVTDRPSTLKLGGEPADVEAYMPLVLINPEVKPLTEPVKGGEGCLSFPEIYGEVVRPEEIAVTALNGKGETFTFECGGLLARAVQHEVDHLHGILFIDRMSSLAKAEIQDQLDDLQEETKIILKSKRKPHGKLEGE